MNRTTPTLLAALGAVAVTAALAGCGSSSSSSSSAPASSTSAGATQPAASTTAAPSKPATSGAVSVAISGFAYHPVALTVSAGTRVTFSNHDATAHTATASSPALDTGTLKPGQSTTVTLKTPGTYSYICQFHPFMHGTVTVK